MYDPGRVVVTGMAVTTPDAADLTEFETNLRASRSGVGNTLTGFDWDQRLASIAARDPEVGQRARRVGRTASRTLRITLATAIQAAIDAAIGISRTPEACAIVVAGSNLQLDRAAKAQEKFRTAPAYLSPRHGYEFYDTHVMAVVAEALDIRGPGLTVGGASASGNVAIATALDLIRCGRATSCLVVGPLPELSAMELHALQAMGALSRTGECHPFDRSANGFVPGDICGAVVLECEDAARNRGAVALAEIAGACCVLGASHLPGPDADGAYRAMEGALRDAGATLTELDCISAHATGTRAGDRAECEALHRLLGHQCGNVPVNAPKSLIGHGLQAAGIVELIAMVLQMRGGFMHGTAALTDPIADDLWLVGPATIARPIRLGLSNSFGFGTIGTSIAVANMDIAA